MKRSILRLVAIAIAAILLLTACGGNSGPSGTGSGGQTSEAGTDGSAAGQEERAKIRVGMVCGGITPLIAQIGINDGSFEDANLDVEQFCFNAGADAVQALVGGSIDINLGSFEHVLRQQKNGLDVKAYGEIADGVGYSLVVKSDSPYQSLADLKGTQLAVTKVGSLSDTGLRKGLELEGIDPDKDVEIISSGSGATMFAAIDSGKVAGGMVSEPTIQQMVATGNYRVLYEPNFPYAGITVMAKTDWVEKNKEAMRRFLQVLVDVNERAQEDVNVAVDAVIADFDGLDREVFTEAVRNQLAQVPEGLRISQEAVDNVTEAQIELGAIDEPIPFDQAVDLSLLP